MGRIPVLFVRMNADLLMGEDLAKTGAGNLFTVFGEPDIDLQTTENGQVVELRGVDIYDPTTGEVRSNDTSKIALWMIDTNYNEESFFVRHCYFTGGNDPYKRLKVALKADIDEDAWASLHRTTSRPFDQPDTGKIAIKVINDYGDEVMKVFKLRSRGIHSPLSSSIRSHTKSLRPLHEMRSDCMLGGESRRRAILKLGVVVTEQLVGNSQRHREGHLDGLASRELA
jgi:hypothetical protein